VVERRVQTFGAAHLDTRAYPLAILDLSGHHIQDGDFITAMDAVETVFRTGDKTFLVVDLSHLVIAPATQRKYAGEWTERTMELQRARSLGGAIVATSAIMRGAITAVQWFAKPPAPSKVFATRDEAIVFAVATIEAAGVDPGKEARDLASVARLALRK
jgi:hypothetical protein